MPSNQTEKSRHRDHAGWGRSEVALQSSHSSGVPTKRLNRPAGERRGRDSNPRYRFKPVHRFSKPTPSASRPPLHNRINIDAGPTGFNWRRRTVIRGLVGCRTKPLHGHAGLHPREPVAPDTRASSIIMKRFSGQASIVRAQGQVRAGHGSDPGGGRTADYRSLRTG